MSTVYFDNAATTALREEVIETMHHSLKFSFGNPSSTHSYGRTAKALIEKARKSVAQHLGAKPAEIYFTSGGTEANNLVLRGAVRDLKVKRIITSPIEHHAVIHAAEALSSELGIELELVELDDKGFVDYADLENRLSKEGAPKTLVSLMHVNNEIGNLLDLNRVSRIVKAHGALFHTDAVQSIGHYRWDLTSLEVHFLSAAAHKFHGPKGIGFLFMRQDMQLGSFIIGGQQEKGFRAGTECVHNILGMERALDLAYQELEQERAYVMGLKNRFIKGVETLVPGATFNGASGEDGSTYTLVNVKLPISGDKALMLLFHLDLKGIACSQGSACQSGSNQGSHVLKAIDPNFKDRPSLRFSFSAFNTEAEVDYVIEVLSEFV